jgi:ABC-type phosphate/phosphonate transport system permease subunit
MSGVMPPSTALLKRSKPLSPAAKRAIMVALGTLIASAAAIPFLAPFAPALVPLGTLLGGVAIPWNPKVKP